MKRKRNTGKRAKIGSHGFKVYKNTNVYIGKATSIKSGVTDDLVEMLQDLWNNNHSTKKMRKFIKSISIKKSIQSGGTAGRWRFTKGAVEIIQHGDEVDWYKGTFYHEVEGHAFWDFSRKWRRENLIKFNELANGMGPVNAYVKDNQKKWKKWKDDEGKYVIKGVELHKSMTRYANEQHSAITEIIRDTARRDTLLPQNEIATLIKAWEELHY
jgi:hypothetical protein